MKPTPIDDEERRGLVRSAGINVLATVGFLLSLIVFSRFDGGWLPPVIACAAFMGIVYYQSLVVVPRLTARRRVIGRSAIPSARRASVGASAS